MIMTTAAIGKPISRVDGRAKVTGSAKYAAEYNVPNLAYGYIVSATVAKGKIARIDASAALAVPGVIEVFTHEKTKHLAWFDRSYQDEVAPPGSPFRPLYDDEIQYNMQPVALVVAEDFGIARYAATLVRVEYERVAFATDLEQQRAQAYVPPKKRNGIPPPGKPRGDADAAIASAEITHEAEYVMPYEHHNPMEMYGSTVVYEPDGKLTIYEKTQGAPNCQTYVVKVFGYSTGEVRVISSYVGGAFGSGLRPQHQLLLAVLAARELKRSVRVSLTREQMFSLSYRPYTFLPISLGANRDGTLTAIKHSATAVTSRFEDYQEDDVNWSGALYKCANSKFNYELAQLDLNTPCDMRAPGGATGMYALECAMDELAYKIGIDPLELRLKNFAEKDQNKDLPFSSNELRKCYAQGAEKFGWSKRNPEPRSMREGNQLIGWGMATGLWDAQRMKASAKALLTADGKLEVSSATTDIGTGTYTIMTQIAAETLGLPMDRVMFRLGDSSMPMAPVEGGSWTAATVGPAVQAACQAVGKKLFGYAKKIKGSPLAKAKFEDIEFGDGQMRLKGGASQSVALTEALRHAKVASIEEEATAAPGSEAKKYSMYVRSAIFAEVKVDEAFGTVRVTRVVNAIAGGRVLNPKTARSQIIGGVVWGIGMALEEESHLDHQFGRFMNHSLAEYHVPVNADIHDIEVIFVEERDEIINSLGVKGLGEIGIVGTASAIANAIYHATGKRVRDLPITLDKVMRTE
ncbi:MAG: xanthine dehydrogenase family protein molybdopterin-binding subunit [Burkholderiales bacterium]|nr:xanthine dehydrogenase family protein molybdopterin-binding subunit [Burkholderiales bacterium]